MNGLIPQSLADASNIQRQPIPPLRMPLARLKVYFVMNAVESPPTPLRSAPLWPLSVAAYRALGEAGLIPKNTELLYGFVYTKISKSPLHSGLVRRLLRLLRQASLPGCFVSSEQPITCIDSEPETDV